MSISGISSYVSNECTNKCIYCGFNVSNNIDRVTLSLDEIEAEAKLLKEMGIEHLLIVAGECKKNVGQEYLCKVAKRLSCMFSSLSIEIKQLFLIFFFCLILK